jgi:hypothetical protein
MSDMTAYRYAGGGPHPGRRQCGAAYLHTLLRNLWELTAAPDDTPWQIRRPRCARFFRELEVGAGAERAISLVCGGIGWIGLRETDAPARVLLREASSGLQQERPYDVLGSTVPQGKVVETDAIVDPERAPRSDSSSQWPVGRSVDVTPGLKRAGRKSVGRGLRFAAMRWIDWGITFHSSASSAYTNSTAPRRVARSILRHQG